MLDSTPFRIAAIGGLLAIFGSLVGPFLKVGDVSRGGTESAQNGTIIIVLTVLTLLALAMGLLRGKRGSSLVGLLLAFLALLTAFLDWGDAGSADTGIGVIEAELGWGLYVATFGTAVMAVGALFTTLIGRKGLG
jgi:hypothetical protein